METFLAIFGGIVLAIIVLFIALRSFAILKANRMMENAIRFVWAEKNTNNPTEQDDIALEMMRSAFFTARTANEYRLALGSIRSLSSDIVKDKQRLADFKQELILFGQIKGWTNL